MLLYCSSYGNVSTFCVLLLHIHSCLASFIRWFRRRSKKYQVKTKPLSTVTMKKNRDEEVEMNNLTDITAEDKDDYSNTCMGDDQSHMTSMIMN